MHFELVSEKLHNEAMQCVNITTKFLFGYGFMLRGVFQQTELLVSFKRFFGWRSRVKDQAKTSICLATRIRVGRTQVIMVIGSTYLKLIFLFFDYVFF